MTSYSSPSWTRCCGVRPRDFHVISSRGRDRASESLRSLARPAGRYLPLRPRGGDRETSSVCDSRKLGFSEQMMDGQPHERCPKLSYLRRLACNGGRMGLRPHVRTFHACSGQSLEDSRLLVDLDRKLQRRCSVGELRERSGDELAKLVEENQVVRSPSCGNPEIGLARDDEARDPRRHAYWVAHLEGILLMIEGHVGRAAEGAPQVPSLADPTFEPGCEASQSPPWGGHGRPEGNRGDDRTAVGKAKRLVQAEDRDVAE